MNHIKDIVTQIENKLNLKIYNIEVVNEGEGNLIIKLTIHNNYELVLKLEKDKNLVNELNSIEVEGLILGYLNSLPEFNFKVPKIKLRSEKYYVYEHIQGFLMKEVFENMAYKEKITLCCKIAEFHYALSCIERDICINIGIKEYDYKLNGLNIKNYDLASLETFQKDMVQTAWKIYANSHKASIPQLIHNDAHAGNILVQIDNPIFIDFGDMVWRDVHYEFYSYVYYYPVFWELIVSNYEKLSNKSLDWARIISISILMNLPVDLEKIQDSVFKNEVLQKHLYLKSLLEKYI